jgi:geranylgeranyl pyrophosphate synthase
VVRGRRFPRVAACVRAGIDSLAGSPAFRDLLGGLLARRGFVLAPTGPDRWPPYVFETCRVLDGDETAAVAAAAAVECAVAAIDVVDDLIDDEWTSSCAQDRLRALNASVALALLTQRFAAQVAERLGPERSLLIQAVLSEGAVGSCAGQDLDLVLETSVDVSEELALEATRRKSGSLVAMACQVGAALATDDSRILDLVGTFGRHLGVCAQLLNDLAGVDIGETETTSDLRRRKKTLPVAFLLRCARQEGLTAVLDWSRGTGPCGPYADQHIATLIHDLGGLHYTWTVADAHHREARALLGELAEVASRQEVFALERLLPSARARPARQ